MKKSILTLVSFLMLTFMCACSHVDADQVAEKVKAKQELTQDDYAVMIDYMEAPLDLLTKTDITDTKAVQQINQKFPYIEMFSVALASGKLNDANKKKLNAMGVQTAN